MGTLILRRGRNRSRLASARFARIFLLQAIALAAFAGAGARSARAQDAGAPQNAAGPDAASTQQPQMPAEAGDASVSISGHVVRADTGAPLPGAIVSLSVTKHPGMSPQQQRQVMRTGADGAFKFSADAGEYGIQVDRSGFVRDFHRGIYLAAGQSVSDVDFQLQPAGAISGSVRDQDDQPIRWISIAFRCQNGARSELSAATDDQGNFDIGGVAPGDCYVAASEPALGSGEGERQIWYPAADSLNDAQAIAVQAGAATPIHFKVRVTPDGQLEPYVAAGKTETPEPQTPATADVATGSISGHVYRADTGAPLGSAILTLGWSGQRPANGRFPAVRRARTGADGAYEFADVEPGTYSPQVYRPGFMPVSYGQQPGNSPGQAQSVTVIGAQTTDKIDYRLLPTGSVSGSVRDQDDVPIAQVMVSVQCPAGPGGIADGSGGQAMTDDLGNFNVSGLLGGDCYVSASPDQTLARAGFALTAYYPSAETQDAAQMVTVKAGADTSGIRITVKYAPAYTITVKVIDNASDSSETRYRISALPAEGGTVRVPQAQWGLEFVQTDSNQIAKLYGMRVGTYSIQVMPMRAVATPNGQVHWQQSGQSVGNARVQVVDGDLSVEIPISRFPPDGQ